MSDEQEESVRTYRHGVFTSFFKMRLVWTIGNHEGMTVRYRHIIVWIFHVTVLRAEIAVKHNGSHVLVSVIMLRTQDNIIDALRTSPDRLSSLRGDFAQAVGMPGISRPGSPASCPGTAQHRNICIV